MATERKTTKRKATAKKGASKKSPSKQAASKKPVTKKRVVKKKVAKRPATKKRPAPKKAAAKPSQAEPAPKVNEPVELTRKAEWSISQFWLNTGFARETVRKRFAEAGLKPAHMVRGYPVFLVSAALPILFYQQDGKSDPEKMRPMERRLHYQAELDRLKLQLEQGEVVPAFEMEAAIGRVIQISVRFNETMPDILERDVGLSAIQLAKVTEICNENRRNLHAEITAEPDTDVADGELQETP